MTSNQEAFHGPATQRLWRWTEVPVLLFWLGVFLWRCRRRNWLLRFPFLPLPPKGYIAWRMELAYGGYPVTRTDLLVDVLNFGDALRRFERL
ncbi:MAG: hypothetical protein HYY13_03960 [Nitrospirae bacterium]|nr:hypothetical protein [Nitrospirota bacterium]